MQTDLLAQLIERKQQVLSQLWQLSQRQLVLIAQGDLNGLLGLLAAKQKLLVVLQQVERELEPFRQQDPDRRVWRSPAIREQTRQRAEQCQKLLSEIIRVERECEAEVIQRRDSAATRLQGAHAAAQARQAYVGSGVVRSGQLDLSSET